MIHGLLIPLLQERFPGRFIVGEPGIGPCVVFPAQHPEVGDVQIHDDGDELTVVVGKFTHGHFSNYDAIPVVEKEKAIAEDVVDFLAQLFADRVVLWGSHEGGGGWQVIDPTIDSGNARRKEFLWSGPRKPGHSDGIARPSSAFLFARALFAFLAMPGIVAFAIPLYWLKASGHTRPIHPLGLAPLILGGIALLWCVRDFYVRGKGTLAPWSPPEKLVVLGLYRYTRNPMYIAVALILLGWAIVFGLVGLYVYAGVVIIAFHLRVVFGEEPWLARTHGAEWDAYVRRVPRWF